MSAFDWASAAPPWNRLGPEIAEHLKWIGALTEEQAKDLAYRIESFWHARGHKHIIAYATCPEEPGNKHIGRWEEIQR